MKRIARQTVENYQRFKHNIFWSPEHTLYKICYFPANTQKSIEFLKYIYSLKNVKGLLLPTELLYDEDIYGYELPYISDSIDIESFLKNPEKSLDIKAIIRHLFNFLEEIHKYFIFNDIRNANILIKDDTPIFIDWDLGIPIGATERKTCSYNVFNASWNPILEDITKTFICAISIFYKCNFEQVVIYGGLNSFKNLLISLNTNQEIIECLNQIILAYQKKQSILSCNLTEAFENAKLPSKKEITRIRTKINP